jgi:hypothetical protein
MLRLQTVYARVRCLNSRMTMMLALVALVLLASGCLKLNPKA